MIYYYHPLPYIPERCVTAITFLKQIIARNIVDLRHASGMTQLELAEKLSYTDKAVSKWERGESIPDITVLIKIAELFGVSVDWLISEEHEGETPANVPQKKQTRKIIVWLSVLLVWFIATLFFSMFLIFAPQYTARWLAYVYAVPVSLIVWLIFNSIWFVKRLNYLIISLLMWTGLLSIFISFSIFNVSVLPIYLLGIPGQCIIILWSRLSPKHTHKS